MSELHPAAFTELPWTTSAYTNFMKEAQEKQVDIIMSPEVKEQKSPAIPRSIDPQSTASSNGRYRKWLQMAIYAVFVLSGQSAATLLGRLYYERGGKSKWMGTLVQTSGFPILLPFLCIAAPKRRAADDENHSGPPSVLVLGSLYLFLGILLAADSMLFSIGLMYLPVSTFSLICASQLGFNALFSYFLNSFKFSAFTINSLILLTTSSVLLVFQSDSSSSTKSSKQKFVEGFVCTLCGAAGYAMILSVSQLAFRRILRRQTIKEVLEVIIYESFFATCAILVGLFASGEWRTLKTEMQEFELGRVSYIMTLVWTALCWQIFSIGLIGLIMKISALFANVISTLTIPIVPVLAVVIFQDKMNGVKAISMFLAIWGFVSYVYQHYLDDLKSKSENRNSQMSEISLVERG